jgi:hypothetical protein
MREASDSIAPRGRVNRSGVAFAAAVAVLLAVHAGHVALYRFECDDAYISFRYGSPA